MNSEVDDQALKEKALTACKDFLGGQWRNISISELRICQIRGGFSNTLYRCSLPENVAGDPQVPNEVLLRIYGPIQEDPNLLVAGAVSFMLLSERRLGPKLYGLLPDGRLEEFIPSHILSSDQIRSYAHLIAREMAKIHSLEVPLRKVPDMFQVFATEWLNEIEDVLHKDNQQYFLSSSEYRKELEWLTKEMEKTNSPTVYCHNDLQGGNILFREDTPQNGNPSLVLIDFEFGCYNYRGFDLANHFVEWCFDYDTPEYPHFKMNFDKFPSRQEQIEFFTNYLDQLSKEGVLLKRSRKEEIDSMLSEVSLFVAAACFLWSIWSAKFTLISRYDLAHRYSCSSVYELKHAVSKVNGAKSSSNIKLPSIEKIDTEAEIKEHGKTRKELFLKFKEQYLASLSDTSDNKF